MLYYNGAKNGDSITVKIMSGNAADSYNTDGKKITPKPTSITYVFDKIKSETIDNTIDNTTDNKILDNTIANKILPKTGTQIFVLLTFIGITVSVIIITGIKKRKY